MKVTRIIIWYFAGVASLTAFFAMRNSETITEYLEKSNRVRVDWGFGVSAIVGLVQYSLLTFGVGIICILTFFLIKSRRSG